MGKSSMPNPVKYKSVGVSIVAYNKLVQISNFEDRAIGRQLSRMIDDAYDDMHAKMSSRHEDLKEKVASYHDKRHNSGGIASVLED